MKMDMQQMLEGLLALQEQIIAEMNASHKEMMAKIDAETKAIRLERKAMRDKRMEANREDGKKGRPATKRRRLSPIQECCSP
jgi:uncharacterized coiled-coil protein SlyX